MHIVGYDTPDGPKCEECLRTWIAGLLDGDERMGPWLEWEWTTRELIRKGRQLHPDQVYDVHPTYATELACMLCENGEDHVPEAGECEEERCEDCDKKL